MNGQTIFMLVCLYGGLLFAIAWWAERHGTAIGFSWWRPLVYSLSIGVYCSSWTFLGAVGRAVEDGWHFLPIYLGPILFFLFGWTFIRKLLEASRHNQVTSIADFIGSRYGKSQTLAAIVTLVLVVGTLPYIALQLRGLDIAWSNLRWQSFEPGDDWSSSLIAALVMAWFVILFGTRVIDGPDRLRGVITAVATESVIKLIAFVAVALLAINLLSTTHEADPQPNFQVTQFFTPLFFTEMLLAATAIICLPRQFHVMAVEYQSPDDTRYTRWLVPIYLAAFAVLALPLAQVGAHLFADLNISADNYVLILPRWAGNEWISSLTFIGAISAATGMVVMATIALSIMISNELIVPLWLKPGKRVRSQNLGRSLRSIRRASIVIVLLLSWALERFMSQNEGLASVGLISFAACAQLLPSVCGALLWQQGHAKGVIAGLIGGMVTWFYCLLLPTLLSPTDSLIVNGPWQLAWLAPQNLFNLGWLDPLSHGMFYSLLINFSLFFFISKHTDLSRLDKRQAKRFMFVDALIHPSNIDVRPTQVEVQQLQGLLIPLLGAERSQSMWQSFEREVGHRLLPHDNAPRFVLQSIESKLASIIGAASAHKALEILASQQPMKLQDFVKLVSGSSKQIQFSQSLLQTTLETVPQGIAVVDKDLKLVAWNHQYQELFDYPDRLLYVGCDIERIYEFNAERGYLAVSSDTDDNATIEEKIEKRLDQLKSGKRYRLERRLPNNKVVEIKGTPLEEGGYVTTYTDITEYHSMMNELEKAKTYLEERVDLRTQELKKTNNLLQRENELRSQTEQKLKEAHISKSRFMASASHDLLQPINAARLFTTTIQNSIRQNQSIDDFQSLSEQTKNLDDALQQTEELISSLREMSRLSSGKEQAHKSHFSVVSLMESLANEGIALANAKGIGFHYVPSKLWVYSDEKLLRRVLQNFVSNALRYTQEGKILLGCRRKGTELLLEVWDTGPGISEDSLQTIFEEFERLPGAQGNQGLGLGLTISQRIAQLLGHSIVVKSTLDKGSVFAIRVPLGTPHEVISQPKITDPNLAGAKIICIDNDHRILSGMRALLEQWGCKVITATDLGGVLSQWQDDDYPDIILADYHLDESIGLDVLEALRYHWNRFIPAIIMSADDSEEIRARATSTSFEFLAKPVKPARLRNTIRRMINENQVS